MPILYENVGVEAEEVEQYRLAIENSPAETRLPLFFRYRHYAALKNDRGSGIHWHYLGGHDVDGQRLDHCTCGLTMRGNPLVGEVLHHKATFYLDKMQLTIGHRDIPDSEDLVVAFIVHRTFDWSDHTYRYDAFCQGCLAEAASIRLRAARDFVDRHNGSC